jgi:hypothetical protein
MFVHERRQMMKNIKIKRISNYRTMVSIGSNTIYLTDKNKRKEVIKRIIETILISILITGFIMGILYMVFCGPYDYWTKEDGYMIKYHVDWDGEEEIVDSYYIE